MGTPNGMLVTGGIGSICMAIAWAAMVFMVVGGAGSGAPIHFGGGGLAGQATLLLLAAGMVFAGGLMQGIGFFGLGRMYSGALRMVGILPFIIAVLVAVVVFLSYARTGPAPVLGYLLLAFLGFIGLGALFGGVGFLSARRHATSGRGVLAFAGILLLVAGLLMTADLVLSVLRVALPGSVNAILLWVVLGGMALGHVAASAAMFTQRS